MKKLKIIINKIKSSCRFIIVCYKYIYKSITTKDLEELCKKYTDYTFKVLSVSNKEKRIYKIQYNNHSKLFDIELNEAVFCTTYINLSDYIIIQDIYR